MLQRRPEIISERDPNRIFYFDAISFAIKDIPASLTAFLSHSYVYNRQLKRRCFHDSAARVPYQDGQELEKVQIGEMINIGNESVAPASFHKTENALDKLTASGIGVGNHEEKWGG